MLYYLFRFLEELDIPGSLMWNYISFRSIFAFMFALLISLYGGKYYINYAQRNRRKFEESQFDESVDAFAAQRAKKEFIPSMGGIVIIAAIVIACLLFGRLRNIYLLLILGTTVVLGFTGFLDDLLKIKRNKNGLAPKWKLVSQLFVGLSVAGVLYFSPDAVIHENVNSKNREIVYKSEAVKSTVTTLPFVKNHNFDYSSVFSFAGEYKKPLGWLVFFAASIFFLMFASNGVNLNDGMDGMAAGNSAIVFIVLGILAYLSSNIVNAAYLNIMYIPGSQELVIFVFAMVGALLGFLWHNANPAKMFMGDTGSLAIGGAIAVLALIIHKELMLFVLCGVFLAELASSKLQSIYAGWGNKKGLKLRVIKRAPLHDSYRAVYDFQDGVKYIFRNNLCGKQADQKVVLRFWIISLLLAALTLALLKVR